MLKVVLLTVGILYWLITLCQNFETDECVDRTEVLKLNFANVNRRYFLINASDEIKNFDSANRVCKLCFDGSLLTFNETKTLPEFVLIWIGVRKLAGDQEFKWANGQPVVNWQNYAYKFKNQHVDPKLNYSVVAYKNGSLITWIATKDSAFEANGRMSAMIDNVSPTLFYSYILNKPLVITCQRPVRNQCHQWNYTDSQCVFHERYGCHGHAWIMFHASDDARVKCEERQPERMAFRCDNSSCITCNVDQWSSWSMCTAKTCRDGNGARKRQRNIISPKCPEDLFHVTLKETETCKVTGCQSLQEEYDENI